MASFIGEVAKAVAECIIIDRLTKWYSYTRNYNANIKKLQCKYDDLTDLRDTIVSQVERDKDNLRKPTNLTQGWLADVEELMTKDAVWKRLLDEENRKRKDQCCFGRLHCNLCQRYEMSKVADKKASEISDLVSRKPGDITEPISISELKPVPSEFFTSLDSRVKLMERIIKKLEVDQVNVVGIFGMGGIGKTTLAKEIANNRAKNKFDETVMVEISEAPTMERIQKEIARQLGLSLDEGDGTELRAQKLYNRLTMKGKKILVILDNIWEKLDLEKVGIPHRKRDSNSSECCCKLLVTSRTKDVCKVMGVEEHDDILKVHPLDKREAKLLFRARLGKMIEKEYEEVEERILNKCQGLPLSIVALADVLKDQDFSMWEHYAAELEKPTSIHGTIRGVNRLTYSILETSYRLMESDEKRRFLLLACLFPFGESIPIEEMMRYGIGMGLFQHVNSLSEAMEQANTWANELKSSSLLLEDTWRRRSHVKIHDVVRASTISLAARGGDKFMVEGFPRWMRKETYREYTGISLMAGTDHSRLRGLNSDKLEILILDSTGPPEFDSTFFEHMTNLKVLVLKGRYIFKGYISRLILRMSIGNSMSSSLRMLRLEICKLGDIGGIGMLTSLEVLSLRESTVEELPAEAMRNLCNLRVLDLSGSRIPRGIPADVLGRLCQLEGLYTMDSKIEWADHHDNTDTRPSGSIQQEQENGGANQGEGASASKSTDDVDAEIINTTSGCKNRYASVDELNELRYLNVLHMAVQHLKKLPIDGDQFVNNLEQFDIRLGRFHMFHNDEPQWRRVVRIGGLDMRSIVGNKSAKALLNKTERLRLRQIHKGLEHVLTRFEFRSVKSLEICDSSWDNNSHLEYDSMTCSAAFPNLKSLFMTEGGLSSEKKGMSRMMMGHQKQQPNEGVVMFPKLQRLILHFLSELEPNVMPIDAVSPHNLTQLHIISCPKLKHIFGKAQNQQPHTNNNNNNNKANLLKKTFYNMEFAKKNLIKFFL